MAYMFDVYALVTVLVFGFAGSLMLALFIANQVNAYRRVLVVRRRIVANSRPYSRREDAEFDRAA